MDGFERLDKKVENPKKLDKVAKKLTESEFSALSDDDVTEIAGGFKQKKGTGYSGGFWIECPECGNTSGKSVKLYNIDDSDGIDSYRCKNCGCEFGVGYDGMYFEYSWGDREPTGITADMYKAQH
jgi:hypothetical protein